MLLLIILVILIFGFGYGGYRVGPGWGYYGGGGISLILAIVLALWNLFKLRRELSFRAMLPIVLLVAINGTLMSQHAVTQDILGELRDDIVTNLTLYFRSTTEKPTP